MHVRRGDITWHNPSRVLPVWRITAALRLLTAAVGALNLRWDGRVLAAVHLLSEGDASQFPTSRWRGVVRAHGANASLSMHLGGDAYVAMHHMIGADVLLKTQSGFSDVAMLYGSGVKLFWYDAGVAPREAFLDGIAVEGPPSGNFSLTSRLRAETHAKLLCHLDAHMQAKWRRQLDGSAAAADEGRIVAADADAGALRNAWLNARAQPVVPSAPAGAHAQRPVRRGRGGK